MNTQTQTHTYHQSDGKKEEEHKEAACVLSLFTSPNFWYSHTQDQSENMVRDKRTLCGEDHLRTEVQRRAKNRKREDEKEGREKMARQKHDSLS